MKPEQRESTQNTTHAIRDPEGNWPTGRAGSTSMPSLELDHRRQAYSMLSVAVQIFNTSLTDTHPLTK